MNGTAVASATTSRAEQLKISEIFYSIQGESSLSGWPSVFVRLTGCPLRCQYCDTEYAFNGGNWLSFNQIIDKIKVFSCKHVCVTGGEPLAQSRCLDLLTSLCDAGFIVSLETSGAMDISAVDPRVVTVMDIKTPDSGEVLRNRWENLKYLRGDDQLKFVICSRADFDWAAQQYRDRDLGGNVPVFFSPSYQQVTPAALADWILGAHLPVRMQLQLHKQIWGDQPGT